MPFWSPDHHLSPVPQSVHHGYRLPLHDGPDWSARLMRPPLEWLMDYVDELLRPVRKCLLVDV